MKKQSRQRTRRRRRQLAGLGLPRRCPVGCPCLCHDTQGGYHDHHGQPCPGKVGTTDLMADLIDSIDRAKTERIERSQAESDTAQ